MGNNFTEKKRSPGSCDGVNIKGILSFARKPCCEHLAAHNSLFVRSSQRNPFGSFGEGLQRGQSPFLQGVFSGEAPLWAEKAGARLECSGLLCGEASKETGRFRGRGIQRGQGRPWHTILLARSSVLHLGRWAGGERGLWNGSTRRFRPCISDARNL